MTECGERWALSAVRVLFCLCLIFSSLTRSPLSRILFNYWFYSIVRLSFCIPWRTKYFCVCVCVCCDLSFSEYIHLYNVSSRTSFIFISFFFSICILFHLFIKRIHHKKINCFSFSLFFETMQIKWNVSIDCHWHFIYSFIRLFC